MATFRSFGETNTFLSREATTLPPRRISPEFGFTRPAARLRTVDFPQPLGPSRTKNSPSPTARSTPRTARTGPRRERNVLLTAENVSLIPLWLPVSVPG